MSQDLSREFPAKINARLSSWKRSTYEDLCVLKQADRAIKAGVIRPSDFIYTALVERGSGTAGGFHLLSFCFYRNDQS